MGQALIISIGDAILSHSRIVGDQPGRTPEPLSDNAPHLQRVLGFSGLTFFLIAALVNLNSVPVVAGMGPAALLFWVFGFILFFIPQGIAVIELSRRFPGEGGIYNWSKLAFGDFHGFISGWCYWTNNIFYVPTLLFYIVGFAAFIGGDTTRGWGESPLFMASISLVLLCLITWLNILGLKFGAWVQTIGATGAFITTGILITLGMIAAGRHGEANPLTSASVFSVLADWRTLSLLSVVCLNYTGLELGSVMGDEIKEPRKTIPRAALVAGISTVVLYLVATYSLQISVPAAQIGVIDGILQAVKVSTTDLNLPFLLPAIAILMSLNAAGNTSAWLAGAARIPFVIGIDRYLPAAFGRIHPKYQTPHVSLVAQAFASGLFIVISAVGATVHDMYMILLQTTVILQLIPYLYMFAGLIVIRRNPQRFRSADGFFSSPLVCYVAGAFGFVVTALGVVLAFVPSNAVNDAWNFELKTVLGTLSFLIPAVILFRVKSRQRRLADMIPQGVEVAPD